MNMPLLLHAQIPLKDGPGRKLTAAAGESLFTVYTHPLVTSEFEPCE